MLLYTGAKIAGASLADRFATAAACVCVQHPTAGEGGAGGPGPERGYNRRWLVVRADGRVGNVSPSLLSTEY